MFLLSAPHAGQELLSHCPIALSVRAPSSGRSVTARLYRFSPCEHRYCFFALTLPVNCIVVFLPPPVQGHSVSRSAIVMIVPSPTYVARTCVHARISCGTVARPRGFSRTRLRHTDTLFSIFAPFVTDVPRHQAIPGAPAFLAH